MAPLVLLVVNFLSQQGVPVDACTDGTITIGVRCPVSALPSKVTRGAPPPPPPQFDPEQGRRGISNGF